VKRTVAAVRPVAQKKKERRMPSNERAKMRLPSAVLVLAVAAIAAPRNATAVECQNQDTGITLSPGFCATVFADNLGHVRHLAVSGDNVVYANTWSGRYYHNDTPPAGGFLLALKDTTGTGQADVIERFGPDKSTGAAGGTGIALYNGALYAELNDKIVRYQRAAGEIEPGGTAQTVLSGMPLTGDHPMHPFAIDTKGNLFVDLGSATNACQADNRMPLSPGHNPCTESVTRAGIWRYDANKTDQTFAASGRYATGIRNGEGFGFDKAGRLYVTQHGRDQLSQNWPKLYTVDQGVELPAEELLELKQGGDYGWPECYYDQIQHRLVLAPEYGGDGGKTVGVCASKQAPVAAFPGHLAPNDLLIPAPSFPSRIATAPSSPSMAHGIARRATRPVTMWSSSRYPKARRRTIMWCSRTASQAHTRIRVAPRFGRAALRWARMAHFTSVTTFTAASGG
jgi:glucose/arabinose dehydrogenase